MLFKLHQVSSKQSCHWHMLDQLILNMAATFDLDSVPSFVLLRGLELFMATKGKLLLGIISVMSRPWLLSAA